MKKRRYFFFTCIHHNITTGLLIKSFAIASFGAPFVEELPCLFCLIKIFTSFVTIWHPICLVQFRSYFSLEVGSSLFVIFMPSVAST